MPPALKSTPGGLQRRSWNASSLTPPPPLHAPHYFPPPPPFPRLSPGTPASRRVPRSRRLSDTSNLVWGKIMKSKQGAGERQAREETPTSRSQRACELTERRRKQTSVVGIVANRGRLGPGTIKTALPWLWDPNTFKLPR